jgi:hypothetical protein
LIASAASLGFGRRIAPRPPRPARGRRSNARSPADRARARSLDNIGEITAALAATYADPIEAERTMRMAETAQDEAEQFRHLATVDEAAADRYEAEAARADQEASSAEAGLTLSPA